MQTKLKKYDYLLHDSYNQGREYNSYGRLMMTSSKLELMGIQKILEETKIFRQDTTELFIRVHSDIMMIFVTL